MSQEDGPLNRLNRLVRKGYVPDFEMADLGDAIWLNHLADGPQLYLFNDGMIVTARDEHINPTSKIDKTRIHCGDRAERAEFDRFVGSLKKPTWRQRTAPARERYLFMPGCYILFFVGTTLAGMVISAIFKTIFS